MEFKKFNQGALDSYKDWMASECRIDISFEEPPSKTDSTEMLAGQVDAVATNGPRSRWLVVVKQVYQPPQAKPKSVKEIAESRGDNFYVRKTSDGEWELREETPIYYACQNILKIYGYDRLDLVVYNPRNGDVMVVPVFFNREQFFENFNRMTSFLKTGPVHHQQGYVGHY